MMGVDISSDNDRNPAQSFICHQSTNGLLRGKKPIVMHQIDDANQRVIDPISTTMVMLSLSRTLWKRGALILILTMMAMGSIETGTVDS